LQKAIDIKLPLSFSTLHQLHHKTLLNQWLGFHDHILKFHDFLAPYFRPSEGLKIKKRISKNFSGAVGTMSSNLPPQSCLFINENFQT